MNGEVAASAFAAQPASTSPEAGVVQRFTVAVIALLSLGSGLLNIYSVIGPSLPERIEVLRRFLPLELIHHARSLALFDSLGQVQDDGGAREHDGERPRPPFAPPDVSRQQHQRESGDDYEEATLSMSLLCALWLVRKGFTVRSREIAWRSGAFRILALFLLAMCYGVLGFWLLEPSEFGRNFNWRQSLAHTIDALSFEPRPNLLAKTEYARWFIGSLDSITVGALIYSGWTLFRPVMYRFRTHPAAAQQARAIVERHGRTAQDFFKFSSDKSFFFSHDASAFIAYRVGADFALALGDPVGPADRMEQLVDEFLAYCRDNGWRTAFHQATSDFLHLYRHCGLRRLKVGDDAIVRLESFSLTGKSAKPLRSKLNQFEKLGIRARSYTPPIEDHVLDQAREVSDEWLTIPGRRERQFTLGRFDRDYLRSTEILAAEDDRGRMLGFLNLIPSFRPAEATLDLMRRRTEAPNGVMDYLFIQAFLIARQRGFERVNLGMAPMSGFQPGEQAAAEERAIHAFFQRLNFVFSFKGLRAYKAKFATEWEPRYLIYRSPLDLPFLPLVLDRVSELPKEE